MKETRQPDWQNEDGTVRLLLGDCLERMSEIADGSIDMVMADLPYGTTACKWDTVIPFEPLWAHYKRVVKPCGAIVLTASQPFTSALVMSNREWFRYEWVWSKRRASGFLDARRKPMPAHESVLVFGESRPQYFPQMEERTAAEIARMRRHSRVCDNPATYHDGKNISKGRDAAGSAKFPRSIIHIGGLNYNAPEKKVGKHPTQKPVALMSYLIRTYTNEGETVLDNTCGSGTTIVACVNTGRRGIGIEKEPRYFDIAVERVKAAIREQAGMLQFVG